MSTKSLLIVVCILLTACSTKAGQTADSSKYTNAHLKAQRVIDSLKLDKNKVYIEIHKTQYVLQLKIGETVIKSYPVVLGFDPVNDKKQEGDGCTPEGIFKVQSKYPHKSWTKFIWFDYPNTESYKKFADRKKKGEIPQTAKIGGEVGIHGVPDSNDAIIDNGINWTLGCISLKTADINEIYDLVKVGTKVVIKH
jgi:murein L,D-transpeptidase YafK